MKYVGIYWTLFAPMMKKSIAKRFDKELADRAIRQGKHEYRRLLYREHTIANGDGLCDYWIVGDKTDDGRKTSHA